jgi:hypothetical protein
MDYANNVSNWSYERLISNDKPGDDKILQCRCVRENDLIHTDKCSIHSSTITTVSPHIYGGHFGSNCFYCGFPVEDEIHVQELSLAAKKHISKTEVYNTTVEVKSQYFDKFAALIGNQFKHGGDKYKLKGFPDREATDVISSIFGGESEFDWVLGTMMKYLLRFKNFEREKDLLKIATYCYILWLKQGNHLKETADEDTKK